MIREVPRHVASLVQRSALYAPVLGYVTSVHATKTPVSPAVEPATGVAILQAGDEHHVAAAFAVVVLAALGAALVARNRLDVRVERTADGESVSESDVLTDRERVRRLVTDNGGRMKQSEIVDSVEWSKAKVSRLLADLEAEGEITKLRLGRENLICLPGHEPPASRSTDHQSE